MGKYLAILIILISLLSLDGCSRETKSYKVQDECGPIQGTIYHSVADNASCRNKCHGQCAALEMNFASSAFKDNGIKCHDCNCTCELP